MEIFFIIFFIVIILVFFIVFYLYKNFYYVGNPGIIKSDSIGVKTQKIDIWVKKLHSQNKFNGGILLIKNGEIIMNNTYGYMDFTKTKELNSDSSFRLASVSKQFTAMGIMILKQQNKLDFDDPVTKYIPNFQYPEITIRHLLNQTSGIPDVYFKLAQQHKDELDGPLSIQKAIELFNNSNTKLKFGVNEKFMYSNTNYILLAGIVENISHQSFEDFMQQNLFSKAGMNNSRVWNLLSSKPVGENQTHSFYYSGNETLELAPDFVDGVAGDGAVFSSLNDLILWDKVLYSQDIVSQEIINQAFTNPVLNNGEKSVYGFGWMVEGDVVRHNGGWLGAKTVLLRNTKEKTMLVIVTNSGNWQVFAILKEFKNIFGSKINNI